MTSGYQIYQPSSDRITCNDRKSRPDRSVDNRQPNASLHTVDLPCSHVLSTVSCHRLSEYTEHDHEYLRDLSRRCMGNDNVFSKLIDRRL